MVDLYDVLLGTILGVGIILIAMVASWVSDGITSQLVDKNKDDEQ